MFIIWKLAQKMKDLGDFKLPHAVKMDCCNKRQVYTYVCQLFVSTVLVLDQVGDVVIPCYTPECMKHDCIFCQSPKTNLCPTIRGTQVSQD